MARLLHELIQEPEVIVAPGVYDSLTAILAEQAGFPAVYLSGAGVAYTLLGRPDLGLITLTEMASRAAYVAEAVRVPVIADGDTGYGNALNVMRTVKLYENAGVAAIQLEDQQFPKRCGHMRNKVVIDVEEMVGKIKAAADARTKKEFLIIARTDARSVFGLEVAVERAARYAEAGADLLFVEAPQTVEELQYIARVLNKPLVANMVEGGRTPLVTTTQLKEWGYKVVLFPNSVTRAIAKTASELYETLCRDGTTASMADRMWDFQQLNDLLGLKHFEELEEKYRT